MVVTEHGDLGAVDFEHLDGAAAGGDGDHGVLLGRVAESQPVGVGVGGSVGDDLDLDVDARLTDGDRGCHQPGVVRVPAEQAAAEAHVRTLALVGGGQRAVGIVLNQHVCQMTAHQIPGQPADAQRGRAVGTRWPAHDRPDHVVEDAGVGRSRSAYTCGQADLIGGLNVHRRFSSSALLVGKSEIEWQWGMAYYI